MESVLDMLRPLHFVFLFVAFAFLALSAAVEIEGSPQTVQNEAEPPQQYGKTNDLETDATFWGGYGRGYGGWGGYGRGYGGYGGYGGWGGGWGGRGYYGGWGGRGYYGGWGGRGYGGWGGYWG
nr:PREDICTED: protein FAM98B-like [Linepithema humile]